MSTFWRRIWNSLEAYSQRRAAVELYRIAFSYSDPEIQRMLIKAANELQQK